MAEPTPPLDLAAIEQRAREAARDCTKPGGWKNAAVYVAERDVPALVARVRALEAEVAEATAIMQRVSERQFAGWQAVQRAVGESHRLDDAAREMRIWLDDRDPAWLAARARFTADDA